MSVRDAYTNWSTTYDTDTNPTRDLDQEVTRATLGHLRVDRVLELGCGTGKNTTLLAQLGKEVQALDFSEGMLERARTRVQAPNVTFTVADLTQPWPCRDKSFNLIVANLVLEHLADLGSIFAEARRCIVPGGQLFICELHPARQYQGLQAHFDRAEGVVVVPAFVHHLSDFLEGAKAQGFALRQLREWWHMPDRTKVPLVVSFLFDA